MGQCMRTYLKLIFTTVVILTMSMLMTSCSKSIDDRLAEAKSTARKDSDAAVEIYEEILDEEAYNLKAYVGLADIYDDDEAYDDLNDLLEDMFDDYDRFEDEDDALDEIIDYAEKILEKEPEELGEWYQEAWSTYNEETTSHRGETTESTSVATTTEASDSSTDTTTTTTTTASSETVSYDEIDMVVIDTIDIDIMEDVVEAFTDETGIEVNITVYDYFSYQDRMNLAFASGDEPDVFIINSIDDFSRYGDGLMDLSGQTWVDDTTLGYQLDDRVIGYPLAITGIGMVYNAQMLESVGIDPEDIDSYEAFKKAFETLMEEKYILGIDAPVATTVGSSTWWIPGIYNFDSYLNDGRDANNPFNVPRDYMTDVDEDRLNALADWTGLLYDNTDYYVLNSDDYSTMLDAFTYESAAFTQMGTWIDDSLYFDVGIIPSVMMGNEKPAMTISVDMYLAATQSANYKAVTMLLDYLSYDEVAMEGMVEMGYLQPFDCAHLWPSNTLKGSLADWISSGRPVTSLKSNALDYEYVRDYISPIYKDYMNGWMDKDDFVNSLSSAIDAY